MVNLNPFHRRTTSQKTRLAGQRLYAVGDIHGRLDLFNELMIRIARDTREREPMRTRCVILGDFVDRGSQSAELLNTFMFHKSQNFVILKGNHEAALLDALQGDHDAMDLWISHGGIATLRSFGLQTDDLDVHDTSALIARARKVIPPQVISFLDELPVTFQVGEYYFVHAGIRPGVALRKQSKRDLLWIGEEFTQDLTDHGVIVVHGHTTYENGVNFARNRIGVDTGAYRTGCLSAVGLEGNDQWVVSTI
jgi:serine/threonine protein phosphatase 1